MPTLPCSAIPMACDYHTTLILAIELSTKNWVLAAQVPGLRQIKAKQTIAATTEALIRAIDVYRQRAAVAGQSIGRVIAIYEAG